MADALSLLLVELLGTEVLRALPEARLHDLVGRSRCQNGKRTSHRHVLCFHIRQFLVDRRLVGRGERNRLHSVVEQQYGRKESKRIVGMNLSICGVCFRRESRS